MKTCIEHSDSGVHQGIGREMQEKAQQNGLSKSSQQESKSAVALLEVRKKFLEYAQKNPSKVHKRDLIRLANDDWYLKRYLLARKRHVEDTLDMLKTTMEWRQEFGLHSREDSTFPQELYKVGALFPYESDKKGNSVIYMRLRFKKKINELIEIEKQFLVHTFEKVDRISSGNGLVILMDLEGAGYSNWDLQFIKFLLNFTKRYAPVGLQYVIVYKLPWILNGMWGLAKKSFPDYLTRRIRFCDENSITDFIDQKNLPDYMGGTCRRNYRWVPPGSPTLFQYADSNNIPNEVAKTIMEQFEKNFTEAESQLQNNAYIDPPEAEVKYINNCEMSDNSRRYHITNDMSKSNNHQMALLKNNQEYSLLTNGINNTSDNISQVDKTLLSVFPEEYLEFTCDPPDTLYCSHLTIYNPNSSDWLAFRLKTNRQTAYSVHPARGLLPPSSSVTLKINLLSKHDFNDKFLVIARSIPRREEKFSIHQFESLWQSSNDVNNDQVSLKLASHVRDYHRKRNSPRNTTAIFSEERKIQELLATCRSLQRGQSISIFINVLLLLVVMSLLYIK